MAMRHPGSFESPNCRGTDPEVFFQDGGPTTETQAAKRVCGQCLHVQECLEWALHREAHGMWGGMSATERAMVRRRRNIILDTGDLLTPAYSRAV